MEEGWGWYEAGGAVGAGERAGRTFAEGGLGSNC
jgi:hypothetical protein